MFMVQILFSVANMESQLTLSRLQSGYRSLVASKGTKAVGRKTGSIELDDDFIKKHTDAIKYIKKGYSYRQIAVLTNKSVNTVMKVKKVGTKLNLV
jgi:DNA invertase Pin-like site-specific DNA recombinase